MYERLTQTFRNTWFKLSNLSVLVYLVLLALYEVVQQLMTALWLVLSWEVISFTLYNEWFMELLVARMSVDLVMNVYIIILFWYKLSSVTVHLHAGHPTRLMVFRTMVKVHFTFSFCTSTSLVESAHS